jgi:septum formation topological specificity factor MinE
MSHFSDEDMEHMEEDILRVTQAFVEYGIEITTKHQEKISQVLITERERTASSTNQRAGLYV